MQKNGAGQQLVSVFFVPCSDKTLPKMKRMILLALLCPMLGAGFALRAGEPSADEVPFNGLIVDAQGRGVKAKISVKHSDKRTTSDRQGRFGLTNLAPDDTLRIRVRNTEVEVAVEGRRSLRIRWAESVPVCSEDEELVDSGFGYVKRREYTSSSSGLTGEKMLARGFSDVQSALLSLVPGLSLVDGQLVIRGSGSINSGNAALIVCDGAPIGSVNSVDIHSVKSVEVQKGSNMYGIRGANGVIIIRTK